MLNLAVLLAAAMLMAPQGTFEKPALISSAGQSSDINVIKALLNTKLKMGLDVNPTAQAPDLGATKTLILVVGASSKGLGAAGLDLDKEAARVRALLKAAGGKGARVLVMHTGGEARRGKTTNDLLEMVMPAADYAVVVAGGNKDKLFQSLASARKTPVAEVENLNAAGEAVKALFKN